MNKLKKYGILMLLMLSVNVLALAQNNANVVRGQVTDKATGETLISVTVTEVDPSNRIVNVTITNYDGEYVLQISDPKNKLRFKYIGFETLDLEIGNKRVINAVMSEQTLTLKDAVITAKVTTSTGTFNIPQREVSMAMQKISAEEFDGIQVASIDDALQGRIAGLDIVNVSGEPGSGMSMRVRGTTSINANTEPLIVINDIPFETEIDDSFDFATANEEQYAQLINVNPDDIESITVLKDAASTAMWGAKGANGVLMITTKRGKAGPTKVTYSYSMTRAKQPKGMNMLDGDGYTMLMKQAYYNPKLENSSSSVPELNYDTNFTEFENYNNNTEWRDEISRIAYTHDNNLTISGGGDKVAYRVSVAYYTQTGTVIGQKLDRLSMRSSIDYNVSDRIRFSSEFSYTYSDNDKNYEDLLSIAYKKMPNLSVYTQDRDGNNTDTYYHILESSGLQDGQKKLSNPVAVANLAMNNTKSYRTSPVFNLSYEFFDRSKTDASLKMSATVSFDINANQRTTFFP
ncbi:MAG: TonB-dependent receptor plug domain-containing protein, partial [Bacteroidales bacterium]|nr:TonB-dependent receptor plug domain-containing protein [Bacteroidales bacterium]